MHGRIDNISFDYTICLNNYSSNATAVAFIFDNETARNNFMHGWWIRWLPIFSVSSKPSNCQWHFSVQLLKHCLHLSPWCILFCNNWDHIQQQPFPIAQDAICLSHSVCSTCAKSYTFVQFKYSVHVHASRNAVTLVWGSLRLAPIMFALGVVLYQWRRKITVPISVLIVMELYNW